MRVQDTGQHDDWIVRRRQFFTHHRKQLRSADTNWSPQPQPTLLFCSSSSSTSSSSSSSNHNQRYPLHSAFHSGNISITLIIIILLANRKRPAEWFYEEMHFSCQRNIDSKRHHHLFARIQVPRTHRNTVGETQQIQKSAYGSLNYSQHHLKNNKSLCKLKSH